MQAVRGWVKAIILWVRGETPEPEPEPSGTYEDLSLSESLTTGGSSSPATKHSPRRGEAVIEAYDAEGALLVLDRIYPTTCAPSGTKPGFTRVVTPHGSEERAHQYVEIAFGRDNPPFRPIPVHIEEKNPHLMKVWWSCHHA